ncbi:24577_t:CDS:2, partial [Dentiscutata erythropus]
YLKIQIRVLFCNPVFGAVISIVVFGVIASVVSLVLPSFEVGSFVRLYCIIVPWLVYVGSFDFCYGKTFVASQRVHSPFHCGVLSGSFVGLA